MTTFSDRQVEMVFASYPLKARSKMLALRELVFEISKRLNISSEIEETLKWGEPSYLSAKGSTIRMNWKDKDPDFYRIFFHCQTSLISTFREIYPKLNFEGNRSIRLSLDDDLDSERLGHCIELALRYHSLKHLPLLGVQLGGGN